MKSIEVKAKTVHEAIEDACDQLGVSQEDVDIEILSQGGMFGKARVVVTMKENYVPSKIKELAATPCDEIPATVIIEKSLPADAVLPLQKGEEKIEEKKISATISTEYKSDYKGVKKGDKFKTTTEFVTKLAQLLEGDYTVTTEDTETQFNINVSGENIGRLIGKNGVVLSALQTVVTSIAISNSNGENKRVIVNVGDYREKRGDTLQAIANKKAEYVKRTGRFVKLDPMNARERAIIHTALQGVEGIKTYSTGKDPFRCLCIAPADKE